ncbi:MAG: LOG family protein [Actinomycetota bacterium]
MRAVIGPGGAGAVVATEDRQRALDDRQWLEGLGVASVLPADAGLRDPVDRIGPSAAEFWASATRRASVASEDDAVAVAAPGERAVRSDRDRAVPLIQKATEASPRPRVAVFGGAWIDETEPEHAEALRLGQLLGERGVEVVNGGYLGVMAAVSRGAREAGGTVVGVTIAAFSEDVPVNRWLSHEVEARDLFARLPLICDADAWVAFPGGVGTLSEVALCWNLIQTESVSPRPLVIVGERWDRALRTFRELLLAEGVDFDLLHAASSSDEVLEALRDSAGVGEA